MKMTSLFGRSNLASAFGLCLVVLGSGAPSAAAVRYEFTALSSFEVGTPPQSYTGSFTFTADGFITTFTAVPAASLDASVLIGSISGMLPGYDQRFEPGAFDLDLIGFGFAPGSFLNYGFTLGAFSTPGTHETVIFGTGQAGRLVVTDLSGGGGPGGVPEPATWAMLIAGFGLVGATLRRRRAVPA
jgi:hypothetical protein